MNDKTVLEMKNIHKSFPGVRALQGVDFSLCESEIHALMGENGAGKSTLIKVLTGVYEKDEGNIYLKGHADAVAIRSPQDAQRLGISTVYQEITLCPNLTVAENMYIGRTEGVRQNWKKMNADAEKILRNLDIPAKATQQLSSCSIAVQQMVAIARAVDMDCKVLILDEPTSSLDEQEVEKLFKLMRDLRARGVGIIFVTHFLDQVYEVCDKITVLRDGKLVGQYEIKDLPRVQLVSKMLGKELDDVADIKGDQEVYSGEDAQQNVYEAEGLVSNSGIKPFDFHVKKGEVTGFTGLLGSGRSDNLKLRNIRAYIPEYPVGTAEECADMIHEFLPVARAVEGLTNMKLISFGPRPLNFLACNAPIKQLYNIGVEIEENSELDLYEAFMKHNGDERIPALVKEMEEELGEGNKKPEILAKLAQYELTLKDWVEAHRGYRKYVAIAGKCWPAFQTMFGFVPCYVNSRLAAQGIPVSCEVDIYGALSEFIGTMVSQDAVTLLDINNSVPADMYEEEIKGTYDYTHKDTFMAFHCGNTAICKLRKSEMKYQKIMARTLPEEVTQGTLEGDLIPGDITFFRLQSTADNILRGYIAQGEILPVATKSFGGIGVFAIPEMGRFYRHVLIEGNYPHHGAVAFGNHGKALFEVFKYIGVPVNEIGYNQPKGVRYPTENPWA